MRIVARLALVAGALAMTTMVASADDAVKKRRALMKEVVKANMGVVGPMIKPKGGKPYDAAMAKEALEKIAGVPAQFVKLFPDGTAIGGGAETAAKPEIWQNMDEFKKLASAMSAAAQKTAETAAKGKDALAEAFRKDLLAACKACHEKFKASKAQ